MTNILAVPPILPAPQVVVTVPDSFEAMVAGLDTLGHGLVAGGWATAATVYAWTEPQSGLRTDLGEKSSRLTLADFAALGIRGLSTRDTVRRFRRAWEEAIEAGEAQPCQPGVDVALPTRDFSFVRAAKARATTPDLPAGVYATIVADPPWSVRAGPDWGSGGASRPLEYPTMDIESIAGLRVRELASEDAHLYIWTINAYLEQTYDVARGWGFEPSTLLTWCKPRHGIGLGGTYVLTSEHVLFCRRGSLSAMERVDSSWFEWPRRGHSVKPDEFFAMVERVSPGPYLEMFARRKRPGWDVWGSEAPDAG